MSCVFAEMATWSEKGVHWYFVLLMVDTQILLCASLKNITEKKEYFILLIY